MSKLLNRAEVDFDTNKKKEDLIYCEKHTCYFDDGASCSKCDYNYPAFKRPKNQVLNGTKKGEKEWDRFVKLGWAEL